VDDQQGSRTELTRCKMRSSGDYVDSGEGWARPAGRGKAFVWLIRRGGLGPAGGKGEGVCMAYPLVQGLGAYVDAVQSDNDPDDLSAVEGALYYHEVAHRRRERMLRQRCIERYAREHQGRLPCEACGFEFALVYGELGTSYVQVHHEHALSLRAQASETLLEEMRVVCANCHAMIHRGGRVRTVDELRHAISAAVAVRRTASD